MPVEGGFYDRARRRVGELLESTPMAVVPRGELNLLEAEAFERRLVQRELDSLGYAVYDYISGRPQELRIQERRRLAAKARVVWKDDPQAGAAIRLLNDFSFGRGVPRPKARDETVQEVLDDVWDDPDNQLVLTSLTGQLALGTDLQLQSNLFVLIFDDGDDGKVKLGLLDHDTVINAVRDENNRLRVLYYVAQERRTGWDYKNHREIALDPQGRPSTGANRWTPVYYPHWRNVELATEENTLGNQACPPQLQGDGKVYHIAVNRTSEMVFGVPEMARLIRWFTAMNDFMAARVDMARAAAAFVMKRKSVGTQGQIERMAVKAMSRRSDLAALSPDSYGAVAGPSRPASVVDENASMEWSAFNLNSGGGTAQPDYQMLHGQLAAGTGLPAHYCLAVGERVLTADLRWVPCGELREGDRLLAFDEGGDSNGKRWRQWSTVTYSRREQAECVRVILGDGSSVVCTRDHPWLVDYRDNANSSRSWVAASDLKAGHQAIRMVDTWEPVKTYEAGWLTGIFDGEGCLSFGQGGRGATPKLSVSQRPGLVADRIQERMRALGLPHREAETRSGGVTVWESTGGVREILRTLGTLRPERLLAKFAEVDVARLCTESRGGTSQRVRVVAVEPAGVREIQSLSTSTRTYIGEGFAMHNTGDPSTANLATATSLELPVLKLVERIQELFEQLFRFLFDRAIERAVEVGRIPAVMEPGEDSKQVSPEQQKATGEDYTLGSGQDVTESYEDQGDDEDQTERDLSYEFSMPSPLRRMLLDLTNAASIFAKTIDPMGQNVEVMRTIATIVLGEGFEVADVAAVVDQMFPPGYQPPAGDAPQAPPPGDGSDGEDFGGDNAGPQGEANPYGAPMQGSQPESNPYGMSEARWRQIEESDLAFGRMVADPLLEELEELVSSNGHRE